MIPADEVLRIARLARLTLTPQEAASLALELASILEHMNVLQGAAAPDQGSRPESPTPTGSDRAGADRLQLSVADLSPAAQAGFFTVPRLAVMEASG